MTRSSPGVHGCLASRKRAEMGFVMGSCCLLHSPIHRSILAFPSTSYSSSSSHSSCLFSPLRMVQNRRKKPRIYACVNQETGNERNLWARRVILFVGFSVLPVLKMTAKAFESWPQGKFKELNFSALLVIFFPYYYQ